MTFKQLIKLENRSKEIWVISPSLHYDVEHKEFSELVSVNLGESTKYRYIVPATPQVQKNIRLFKKRFNLSEQDISTNFLLLPPSEINPFLMEIAIYNASSECIACAAPAADDSDEVIVFKKETAQKMAKDFVAIWKKYKRSRP